MANTAHAPVLPYINVDWRGITCTGTKILCPSGASITDAILAADAAGRQIVETDRGGSYGVFEIPERATDAPWLDIRPAGWDLDEETMLSPDLIASVEPSLVEAPDGLNGILFRARSRRVMIRGFEVRPTTTHQETRSLIATVDTSGTEYSQLSDIPSQISLRHIYVHGIGTHYGTDNRRFGITLGATNLQVATTWADQINYEEQSYAGQAQTMSANSGLGRLSIYRVFCMGSSEPLCLGGSGQFAVNTADQAGYGDITIDRSHIYRPLSVKPYQASENGIEGKIGRRWLIQRTILDGGWPSTQQCAAFVFWSNDNDAGTWIECSDITIKSVWVRNYPKLFQLSEGGVISLKPFLKRCSVSDLLATGIGSAVTRSNYAGSEANYAANMFQIDGGLDDLSFERVTALNPSGYPIKIGAAGAATGIRFNFRNSVVGSDYYGADAGPIISLSDGAHGSDSATNWADFNADGSGRLEANVLVGGNSLYAQPAGNDHVTSVAGVGFVDATKVMGSDTTYADLASCAITGTYAGKGCDITTLSSDLTGVEVDRTLLASLYP